MPPSCSKCPFSPLPALPPVIAQHKASFRCCDCLLVNIRGMDRIRLNGVYFDRIIAIVYGSSPVEDAALHTFKRLFSDSRRGSILARIHPHLFLFRKNSVTLIVILSRKSSIIAQLPLRLPAKNPETTCTPSFDKATSISSSSGLPYKETNRCPFYF